MPKSPRIQVVVSPQLESDLKRIARYSDTSVSALVARMIEESAGVLHQLADTLEQAHGLSARLPVALSAKLDALGRQVQDTSDALQGGLDDIQAHVSEHDPDVSARPPSEGRAAAPGSRSRSAQPPQNNKGARMRGLKGGEV